MTKGFVPGQMLATNRRRVIGLQPKDVRPVSRTYWIITAVFFAGMLCGSLLVIAWHLYTVAMRGLHG